MAKADEPQELHLKNRKAYHLYEIIEKVEAGVALLGTEVKSIRGGDLNFTDSWVSIEDGEAYIENLHIGTWRQASQFNHAPLRRRKLLLHKIEIRRLGQKCIEKGLTVVPLSIYLSKRWIKVELGLARGKKLHDKRESLKKKEDQREVARALKERSR
jgi:SsrA-binding protein